MNAEKMASLLGLVAGEAGNRISKLFDFREAAEIRAEIAISKHPTRSGSIEKILRSYPGLLLDFDRAISGTTLVKPTHAERCAFFCQLSLKSPLKHDYVEAYQREMSLIYSERFEFQSRGARYDKEIDDVIADVDRVLFKIIIRS